MGQPMHFVFIDVKKKFVQGHTNAAAMFAI